jgi:hypothetical protein
VITRVKQYAPFRQPARTSPVTVSNITPSARSLVSSQALDVVRFTSVSSPHCRTLSWPILPTVVQNVCAKLRYTAGGDGVLSWITDCEQIWAGIILEQTCP